MKRFLVFALLFVVAVFAAPVAVGQVNNFNLPDCEIGFRYTVTANVVTNSASGSPFNSATRNVRDNRFGSTPALSGCTLWHLEYWTTGTVSAPSVELDFAPDTGGQPGSWTVWTASQVQGTLPLTAVTGLSGTAASMYGFSPWVSVLLSSATGTGEVVGVAWGWRPQGVSDIGSGASPVNEATYAFKNITTNTNTQIKVGSGNLHSIVVNLSAAGTVKIVDTSAANCSGGTTIGTMTLVANAAGTQFTQIYDVVYNSGLCITTSASPDITVSFK